MRLFSRLSVLFVLVVGLAACTTSRYSMKHDAAPQGEFDASQIPNAIPKWEPLSRGGNRSPYTVRGQQYEVMSTAKGYVEEGMSSWYGLKFHGELTSNGEIYNMYAMTAAHKTLPLPSYLRVTNIGNGQSIIVRVNDRGPFHEDRIVDLSYAAAIKLGFHKQGTAQVRLEAITPHNPNHQADDVAEKDLLAQFVQIAAFSSAEAIDKVRHRMLEHAAHSPFPLDKFFVAKSTDREKPIFRLRMGPFLALGEAERALDWVRGVGLKDALLITRSVQGKHL